MRVLMTGGGTGGHVYPALAIASVIRRNDPDAEIAFVGTPGGMENKLVGAAGYEMYHVNVKGFRRSLSLKNLYAMYLAFISPMRAKSIVRKFKPDIVIGTGGYVSWPILVAASKLGVPTAVHESNAVPGMAVRRLASYVDRVYINYPESAELLSHKEKALRVGCPLRIDFEAVEKQVARQKLGIPADAKVILSFGGSLGAEQVNFAVLDLMEDYVQHHPNVVHIHATGSIEWEIATGMFKERGLDKKKNIRFVERAAVDKDVFRIKKPAIFIPSPNVTDNQQFKNANAIAKQGGAMLIEEKDLKRGKLEEMLIPLLNDPVAQQEMGESVYAFAVPDANRRIYEDILHLIGK